MEEKSRTIPFLFRGGDMKQRGSNKWLRMVCLLLGCTSLVFLYGGFLGQNLFAQSDVGRSGIFARTVEKEIYSLRSPLKSQDNLVTEFIWSRVDKVAGPEGLRDEVEPIFMILNGQFVDPSEETKRVGFEIFNQRWFAGKSYPIYARGEEIGKLSDFSMKLDGEHRCKDELWGEATYKGRSVLGGDLTIKVGKEKIYPSSMSLFGLAKRDDSLFYKDKPPRSDIKGEPVKRIKELGGLEFEKMVQRVRNPVKDVEADQEWRGVTIEAIDLDGNGNGDLIAQFDILIKYKYRGQQRITIRTPVQIRYRLFYVLYDNGKGEVIWPSSQNGAWLDGLGIIQGFFNIGEPRPAILIRSNYPMNFIQHQNEPFQYELLAHRNGKGWVTIFKGRPSRCW